MKGKMTKLESESEMCDLGNNDYEKVKVKCMIEGNASKQRMADCPLSFSNHDNEAHSYNGNDDETKSDNIRK